MGKFIAAGIAIAVAVLVFMLISLLFIKLGWYLFMVPVFGMADLTWLQALGFAFLAGSFRSTGLGKKD